MGTVNDNELKRLLEEPDPAPASDEPAEPESEWEIVEVDLPTPMELINACYFASSALEELGGDAKLQSESENVRQFKAKRMLRKLLYKGISDLYADAFPPRDSEVKKEEDPS
jgi:hypothetical protein